MSINAIEILEARLKNRTRKPLDLGDIGIPYYGENLYHSSEWWNDQWEKHQQWVDRVYPVPAGTGYEVTPVTGVPLAD